MLGCDPLRRPLRTLLFVVLAAMCLAGCGSRPAPHRSQCTGIADDAMVWIPDGRFVMGGDPRNPEEGPPREVAVKGFWMDAQELTNAEFAAFVKATGYRTMAERAPPVLPGAALEQRHQFLTEQLSDLEKTRLDLIQIIDEVDDRMQSIFIDAFRDTKAAFDAILPVLFPGGTGHLTLTDPDSPLTTGIEVSVKPAGKKIERLSLLSGGERSLAAVALLVAIFKARPSPFYILDEVEAALDDANLGRLLSIFEELRTSSQLIIITHQKRTMEIADALYGVSMRDDGVSAVVGQRIAAKVEA